MQLSLIETIVYTLSFILSEILPFDQRFISNALLSFFQSSSNLSLQHPALLFLQGYLYWILAFTTFIFFRHEWASMLSSLAQLLILRKKPEAMDERIPIYVIISFIPSLFVLLFLSSFRVSPYQIFEKLNLGSFAFDFKFIAVFYLLLGGVLYFIDQSSRKIKGLYDLNLMDSILSGIFLALALLPGTGFILMGLIYFIFRGYQRDVALKYTYFCAFLYFFGSAIQLTYRLPELLSLSRLQFSWNQLIQLTESTVLNFTVLSLVAIGSSFLVMSSFTKAIQKINSSRLFFARLLIVLTIICVWYFQNKDSNPTFADTASIGKLSR